MNLSLGLIREIENMGGSDVWLIMRPDAIGVSYFRRGRHVRHGVALPFGTPSDETLAVLLELADDDFQRRDDVEGAADQRAFTVPPTMTGV